MLPFSKTKIPGESNTLAIYGKHGSGNNNNILINISDDTDSTGDLVNYIEHQWFPDFSNNDPNYFPHYFRTGIHRGGFTQIKRYAIHSQSHGELLSILPNGNVGIGTVGPSYPLEVTETTTGSVSGVYFNNSSTTTLNTQSSSSNFDIAIWANGYIATDGNGFIATSDRRIKKDIQTVSDSSALGVFRQLNPSTYHYIDTVNRPSHKVFGFIAQEVKDVLPEGVKITRNVVPDYYSTVSYGINDPEDTLTISFNDSYTLSENDTIRLYIQDTNEIVHETKHTVTSISNNQFTISASELDFTLQSISDVFFYGKWVDDFHTLNKDVIWTVASAALQEVDRTVETLRKENHTLRGKVTLTDSSGSVTLPFAEEEFTDPQVFLQNNDGWSQVKGAITGNTLTITSRDTGCTDTVDYMVVLNLVE